MNIGFRRFLEITMLAGACCSRCFAQPAPVFASGLVAPIKLSLTAAGNLIVAEGATAKNAARISIVNRSGARRDLLTGLPAGAGREGGFSGPTAVELRDRVLWVLIGQGDVLIEGTSPGTEVSNPKGPASPIFSSLLSVRFSADPEMLSAGFRLTPDDHFRLADGLDVQLDNGAGATATVQMVADFRDVTPDPLTIVRGSNPFGMAFDVSQSNVVYVADAGLNALMRVDTATGRVRTLVHFPPIPNPSFGPPVIDAVPTSVRAHSADQLLVTFLTGFPFPPGSARVVLVNPSTGAITPFINSLASAMDIVFRDDPRRQYFTLEFSTNQSAQQAPPGRLQQYDSPTGMVIPATLITHTSMALDAATGDIYITELGPGLIVRLKAQ